MEAKNDGYSRYRVIFDNIRKICRVVYKPREIIKGQLEGISEETCEGDCKHYILGKDIHVYIRGEYIFISESDVQQWGDEKGRSGEKTGQFFIAYNKETIDCICHANNGSPYSIVQYFNHEEEDEIDGRWGKNNVFIPKSFEDSEGTSAVGENVPADIEEAISNCLHESTQQDVRTVCQQIKGLDEKIKKYERIPDIQQIGECGEKLTKLGRTLQRLRKEIKLENDNSKRREKVAEIKKIETEISLIQQQIPSIKMQIEQILSENQVPREYN